MSESLLGKIVRSLTGADAAEDDCCCGVEVEELDTEEASGD